MTTMLSLRTITPLAGRDDTFNVRWAEVSYDTSGKKQAEYELEAFFSVEQVPLDEKTMYINPLGIKIKDFTMSQVQ
jgi:type IV secretory pathway TrbF-like protein